MSIFENVKGFARGDWVRRIRQATRWTPGHRVKNRFARPAADAGMMLGSSRLPLKLRGRQDCVELGSCVAMDRQGTLLHAGDEAASLEGRVPPSIRVSHPIREGRLEDLDGGRRLIEQLLRQSRHGVLFGPHLIVGVSSDLSALERRTVEEVARAAGARKVHMIEQSILIALGAGLPALEPTGCLVVDLGAGEAEISLISTGKPVMVRRVPEFGRRIDLAIREHLRREHQLVVSPAAAEALKKDLGSVAEGDDHRQCEVTGRNLMTELPDHTVVTSAELRQVVLPILEEVALEIRTLIKEAPSQLVSDVVSNGAVLAGGGARLAGAREYLQEHTALSLRLAEEPELTGVKGLEHVLSEPTVRRQLLATRKVRHETPRSSTGRLVVLLLLSASLLWGSVNQQNGPSLEGFSSTVTAAAAPVWRLMAPSQADGSQARLTEHERKIQVLEQENERLRRLANAPVLRKKAGQPLVAQAVARSPESWNSELVLDAGKRQGVAPGMIAQNETGLIGTIDDVSPESSTLRLFIGPDVTTGVRVARTKSTGVLYGGEAERLELRFLDPDDGVKPGDAVFTSGLDGQYPEGLKVGTVTRVDRPKGELYLTAMVEPHLDLDELREVLLTEGAKR